MEIFYSKSKLVKAFLLGLLMTTAAIFVAVKVFRDSFSESRSVLQGVSFNDVASMILLAVCILGILIFGGAAIAFLLRLFQSEPQVIVSLEGLEDKRLGIGIIEWDEIASISLMETNFAQWLNLILHSPEKFYPRLSKFQVLLRKANGQKGINSFRIRFTDLDKQIDEAWEFIENKIIKPRAEKGIHLMP